MSDTQAADPIGSIFISEPAWTVETGGTYAHQYRIIRNDSVIWVRAKGHRILDKSGRPDRFPDAIMDITATMS